MHHHAHGADQALLDAIADDVDRGRFELLEVIVAELTAVRDAYATPRRTEIAAAAHGASSILGWIGEEQCPAVLRLGIHLNELGLAVAAGLEAGARGLLLGGE